MAVDRQDKLHSSNCQKLLAFYSSEKIVKLGAEKYSGIDNGRPSSQLFQQSACQPSPKILKMISSSPFKWSMKNWLKSLLNNLPQLLLHLPVQFEPLPYRNSRLSCRSSFWCLRLWEHDWLIADGCGKSGLICCRPQPRRRNAVFHLVDIEV